MSDNEKKKNNESFNLSGFIKEHSKVLVICCITLIAAVVLIIALVLANKDRNDTKQPVPSNTNTEAPTPAENNKNENTVTTAPTPTISGTEPTEPASATPTAAPTGGQASTNTPIPTSTPVPGNQGPTPTPSTGTSTIGMGEQLEVNLTSDQAYAVLCAYPYENLGLSKPVDEYNADYDDSLTLVKGLNCYRINLSENSDGKIRNRGDFFISIDGENCYTVSGTGEFVLISK
ncbi:MAG: hypothetical protein K6B75_01395 [Lachnospiraceae bacterium]|nr:hypothetical protein [Lachnospiraceae bacterium]